MKIFSLFLLLLGCSASRSLSDTIVARGFQFCPQLDGSRFKSLATIGNSTYRNIVGDNVEEFVSILDQHALEFFEKHKDIRVRDHQMHSRKLAVDQAEFKRFSCYLAADGFNSYISYSDMALLVELDVTAYFPSIPYHQTPETSLSAPSIFDPSGSHQKCKVGYMLLVHDNVDTVMRLIGAIDDPEALIVIHMDGKYPDRKRDLEARLVGHGRNKHVLTDPMAVHWGHSSIVMAQMMALFKLQDLGPCEYYINLSAADYPLLPFRLIYERLSKFKNQNWFEEWSYSADPVSRMYGNPGLLSEKSGNVQFVGFKSYFTPGPLPFLKFEILPRKAAQWMAITDELVILLRTSPLAILLLAHVEFTFAPDEVYFVSIAHKLLPVQKFRSSGPTGTVWKRFAKHPITLDHQPHYIFDFIAKGYLFARKFSASNSSAARKDSLDALRKAALLMPLRDQPE